jgi:hypothetical protein
VCLVMESVVRSLVGRPRPRLLGGEGCLTATEGEGFLFTEGKPVSRKEAEIEHADADRMFIATIQQGQAPKLEQRVRQAEPQRPEIDREVGKLSLADQKRAEGFLSLSVTSLERIS